MAKFEIRNRWTASLIFECEAISLRVAVEKAFTARLSLRDANLSGADLRDADLRGADLRGANLSGANLSGADLRGANLSGANLSGADLSGADLSGADLSGADLSGADLSGADLSGADLRDADLRDADLRDADLSGANLSGANLSDANLSGADLRDANLSGADLSALKTDFFTRLGFAKEEVVGLYKYLVEGKVEGRAYRGECACFVGTIANVRGVAPEDLANLTGLKMEPASLTEKWFLGIRKGDTPENCAVSAVTVGWIKEWAKEHDITLPFRKVRWE